MVTITSISAQHRVEKSHQIKQILIQHCLSNSISYKRRLTWNSRQHKLHRVHWIRSRPCVVPCQRFLHCTFTSSPIPSSSTSLPVSHTQMFHQTADCVQCLHNGVRYDHLHAHTKSIHSKVLKQDSTKYLQLLMLSGWDICGAPCQRT